MAGPTPSTTFTTAGPGNVRVPRATGRSVEYARDANAFTINKYIELTQTETVNGVFPELNPNDTVASVTPQDYEWPDAQERPEGDQIRFRWQDFSTRRRAYGFTIGSLSVDQADWDIVASNSRGKVATAMTDRTREVVSVLTTAANWPTANQSATLAALGVAGGAGGDWTASGTADNFIKESINLVRNSIKLATGGVAGVRGLKLVVNPDLASAMGKTAEILAYLVNHETAMQNLNQMNANQLSQYGLPPFLYGCQVCVEDAVGVSSRMKADGTGATDWVFADNAKAVFTTVEGDTAGNDDVAIRRNAKEGSYSTMTIFEKEPMTVEIRDDSWNRRVLGSVVDNRVAKLAAAPSGYIIEDVTT